MTAPSDPVEHPPRPIFSHGFWLMMALSGLSLAGAITLTLMAPKPAGPRHPGSTVRPRPSAVGAPAHAGVDSADHEAWLDMGHAAPEPRRFASGPPTDAVEIDDDFGAALQPAAAASVVSQTLELLRALGGWPKGR